MASMTQSGELGGLLEESSEGDMPGTANATAEGPWLGTEGPSRIFTAPSPSMMGASMMTSTDSVKKGTRRSSLMGGLGKDGRCLSAPLLPAAQSTHASTWYTASTTTGGASVQCRSFWKPLASSWRDWDSNEFGAVRTQVDDGRVFKDGCIPHWGKSCNLRKRKDLEHELTFAWYRSKRHIGHPHRAEVGDPILPQASVVAEMRSGRNKQFQFWRDLRPPFDIVEVRRMSDEEDAIRHPEGDLYEVTIECPIDYEGERLWNTKSVNGTFDNKVHTVCKVRIPDGYPRQRPITILNWGQPQLNWSPSDERDEDGNPLRPVRIDPSKWMPISDELKQRADLPRFAHCREATRKADSKKSVQTQPLQKILLSRHPSLRKMASIDVGAMVSPVRKDSAHRRLKESNYPPKKVKPKERTLFTACGGFVRYAG